MSAQEVQGTLASDIEAVFAALDADSTTELLRGYYDAYSTNSDLQYDVDDASRYWLSQHDLLDDDTVTDMSLDVD